MRRWRDARQRSVSIVHVSAAELRGFRTLIYFELCVCQSLRTVACAHPLLHTLTVGWTAHDSTRSHPSHHTAVIYLSRVQHSTRSGQSCPRGHPHVPSACPRPHALSLTSCSAHDSARADNAPRSNPHGPVAVPRDPAPSSYPDMSVLHVREQHALTTVQSPTPAIPISREPVTLGAHARQLRPGSHLVLPERSHLVLPERSVGQARNV